jgi:hypothetical protein
MSVAARCRDSWIAKDTIEPWRLLMLPSLLEKSEWRCREAFATHSHFSIFFCWLRRPMARLQTYIKSTYFYYLILAIA